MCKDKQKAQVTADKCFVLAGFEKRLTMLVAGGKILDVKCWWWARWRLVTIKEFYDNLRDRPGVCYCWLGGY